MRNSHRRQLVQRSVERLLARALLGLPRPLLERWARRGQSGAGPRLDPQLEVLRTLVRLSERWGQPSLAEASLEGARSTLVRRARMLAPTLPLPSVDELIIERPPGSQGLPSCPLKVRRYRPTLASTPQPAMVYFHGGGWVLGNLDSHDGVCRELASKAGVVILSVDYRLAPEAPFPAAVEDAFAAFHACVEHAAAWGIDPLRVAVGGDSAGGNLAAVTCLLSKERGHSLPAFQLLLYPITDLTCSLPSHRLFARGYFLERADMEWFRAHYVPAKEQWRNPLASPLFAADCAGLPRAHVVTAGCDLLRDEGEAYAQLLARQGVPVTYRCYQEMVHGFLATTGAIDAAREAMTEIAGVLRRELAVRDCEAGG